MFRNARSDARQAQTFLPSILYVKHFLNRIENGIIFFILQLDSAWQSTFSNVNILSNSVFEIYNFITHRKGHLNVDRITFLLQLNKKKKRMQIFLLLNQQYFEAEQIFLLYFIFIAIKKIMKIFPNNCSFSDPFSMKKVHVFE